MNNTKLNLDELVLSAGAHAPDSGEACVMEAVAYVAGEPWTDAPQCASPVIAAFCRRWNDTDEPYGAAIRERLKTYVPRLVGSRGTPEVERRRAWLALDWLIRVYTPTWLRLVPALVAHADALAALPPQTSDKALRASAAARAAAWDAAGDAGDAARAAAWAAAGDAWAAAGAARAAAWATAG
ncbi:MAG: hypothetical protein IVW57_03200, partial [Ktedonobacterales bacterium]|nr:hypothetical protein [Ktedonobacterales bacterium]